MKEVIKTVGGSAAYSPAADTDSVGRSKSNMNAGLVSVTFRGKRCGDIVSLAKSAGLGEIEWGGDVHIPSGELETARSVGNLCRDAEICVFSYGSYYRAPVDGDGFDEVLNTAKALGAESVRIWAGSRSSRDTDEQMRLDINERIRRDAGLAGENGMSLSFEYHIGTLTDCADSALRLLSDVGSDNVRLHWQPNQYETTEYNVSSLRKVAKYVDTVHVFAWEGDRRLPLKSHEDQWRRYFEILSELGAPRAALLEFLPRETEDDLMRDAETLLRWVS